jgi:plasmid stability protein
MAKTVQIRNVPDKMYRVLKARADHAGLSMSEYVRGELRRLAERPTPEQIRRRLAKLPPVHVTEDPADIIRRLRDGGDRE